MRTNKVNPNDRNIYQKYNDIQKTKKRITKEKESIMQLKEKKVYL